MAQRILATIVAVMLMGLVLVALVGASATSLLQQGGSGSEGCGSETDRERVTVSGTVSPQFEPGRERDLILDVPDLGPVHVGLGPWWYQEQIGFTAQAGDQLTVTGYDHDGTTLDAHTIVNETAGQTFAFRDEEGHPLWSGGQDSGH